ncbi:alpha-amylase family glycosyl hydrolase [Dyadobacter sp. CY326]|uniref:alpha-amylase family glycosyl hydrolase n=1 Tax=Dyadobacter sp. CY326 TaxID=2907300 RepID=UPI001F23E85E|nr:alpha-amylase family glycosyl hydrolase [Dyadobacter sp. CY326]MCE7067963.1 hypothetical protein [Dyadobacter sp. CY326]
MNNNQIVTALFDAVQNNNLDIAGADKKFYTKLVLHASEIRDLYTQLYANHPDYNDNFTRLIEVLIASHQNRLQELRDRDYHKDENWYLSNQLAGMSLYIDRFCGNIEALPGKFPYLRDLGVNVLHLMPSLESSDGKINSDATSDLKSVDLRFENLRDLEAVRVEMHANGMNLMLGLDLNHDFNSTNPQIFVEMLANALVYANLGVDILRINASATHIAGLERNSQNASQTHTIFQLLKQCVQVTAPGMALLGESITEPGEIMKCFGEGRYLAKEFDFAYNTTQMALQWDALASGQVSAMMAAQPVLSEKPFGTTWITYTRNHNDIALDYDDHMILDAGFTPNEHRKYLSEYFSDSFSISTSSATSFAPDIETPNTHISGTLASLCGLEKAVNAKNEHQINISIQKMLLMQANSFFVGGLPVLFYGDEAGYFNDYSFQDVQDNGNDDRWMNGPLIDWEKNRLVNVEGTVENRIYAGTKKLLEIRAKLPVVADVNNTRWLPRHNIHVAGFVRNGKEKALFCIFNYSNESAYLTWHSFRYNGLTPVKLYDHWRETYFETGNDADFLILESYAFYLLEVVD